MSRRARGFTLTDVGMGLVIVSILFFGLALLFPVTLSGQRKSQRLTVAANLARQAMENWQYQPFDTVAYASTPQTSTATVDSEPYTITINISNPADTSVTHCKQIDVQVTAAASGQSDGVSVRDSTCVFDYSNQ